MSDFLNNLYSQENFGLWLMISIIVLMIIFVVVLLFGRKDKKKREIEETKKLMQINNEQNAFKEEDNLNKVEVNSNPEVVKEVANNLNDKENKNETVNVNDAPIEAPLINNVEENNNQFKEENIILPVENIEPTITLESTPNVYDLKVDNIKENAEEENTNVGPLLTEVEPELNINVNTNNENTMEEIKLENEEIKVPEYDLDSIINDITKEININPVVNEVEEKEESTFNFNVEDKSNELNEQSEPVRVQEPVKVPDNDELDFELPALKKEYSNKEEIEVPKLNDYNLDNLAGESYNINNK